MVYLRWGLPYFITTALRKMTKSGIWKDVPSVEISGVSEKNAKKGGQRREMGFVKMRMNVMTGNIGRSVITVSNL